MLSPYFLFIGGLGPTELIVILVIVLILFGGKRLPSLARSIGSGVNEFKKGLASGEGSSENIQKAEETEETEETEQLERNKKTSSKKTKKKK